jgi:glycosyltransferase involved in cell wall biosynthesis
MDPLVTFLICSFNHDRFIREAVTSTLAQDDHPLEVIVLDDCSTDRSFEILQEIAASYTGPHSLEIHRNARNLGIGRSFSHGIDLCHGELIVVGAGDDAFMPDRARSLRQAWEQSGRTLLGLFSSYVLVSEDGTSMGVGGTRGDSGGPGPYLRLEGPLFHFLSTRKPMVNGCTAAWSSALFKYFGPVSSDLEDVVLSFRALALGGLGYIDRPLVQWRRHGGNFSFLESETVISFEERETRLKWVNEASIKAFDDIIADIETLCKRERLTGDDGRALKAEAERVKRAYRLELRMMEGHFFGRLLVLADIVVHGDFSSAIRSAPRCLPRGLYKRLYLQIERRRSSLRSKGCEGAGEDSI